MIAWIPVGIIGDEFERLMFLCVNPKFGTVMTFNVSFGSLCGNRKERPVSLGIFQLQGGDVRTPDLQREQVETPGTDTWRFNDLSHPRSNTSLKVGKTLYGIPYYYSWSWPSLFIHLLYSLATSYVINKCSSASDGTSWMRSLSPLGNQKGSQDRTRWRHLLVCTKSLSFWKNPYTMCIKIVAAAVCQQRGSLFWVGGSACYVLHA